MNETCLEWMDVVVDELVLRLLDGWNEMNGKVLAFSGKGHN